jgi:hypothetical protein
MKTNWLAAMALAIAAWTGAPLAAHAQTGVINISDADVEPASATTYEVPAATASMAVTTEMATTTAGGGCGDADDGCVDEPWRFFCQRECGWSVFGWVDAGATANGQPTISRYNGPVTFNDRREGMLNQLYAVTEKKLCIDECGGWDWGGRVDLLYGTDYIFTQAIGLETRDDGTPHWNGSPFYGLAMPQLYAELGYNDLSMKLGHFYTPIGYEGVMAPNQFFYSHAYTHQYGEPFTHTGLLATWKRSDNLSLIAAAVNGWDAFDRESDVIGVLGGLTWTNGDALSLALIGISSKDPTQINSLGEGTLTIRNMYSLVVTYVINDCWTYVFQHDYGHQDDGAFVSTQVPGIGSNPHAEWYGINQYLFRKINDCWTAGFRFEWFRDDDGARVTGIRPDLGHPLFAVPGAFAGNFYEVTAGLNWKPNANLIVRPELRYDWYSGLNLTGIEQYDDGTQQDQFLAALDVIFLW